MPPALKSDFNVPSYFTQLSQDLEQFRPADQRGSRTRPLHFSDLRIRTKQKTVIPFVPNAAQRLYLAQILPGWEKEPTGLRGLREIILKARQEGFSTLILALFFLDTITHPNTQTVIIAHDAETTERLFQMVHRFHKLLPAEKQRRTRYSNRRELVWEDLDSNFFVGTAGAGEFGRGGTINNVHMSEVGVWKNGEEIVSGLLQSVPPDGNVFAESTAKGLGNWFHSEWTAAEKRQSAFAPRFFGWHELPEYRKPVDDAFTRTDEEQKLVQAYGLDDAQLNWRRGKVLELRDLFPQEYPANPREAFIASGNPYFNRVTLDEISTMLEGAEYDPLRGVSIPAEYPRLRKAYAAGELELWEPPTAGAAYVCAADTAEGITDGGDHDYDSADVFHGTTWEQAAHLHGRWDTHEYGLLLAELGRWYNTALLGIERNNHGHAVINAAMHGAEYPLMGSVGAGGLYLHEEYDERKKVSQRKPGWPTTPKTKFFALDGLATSLEDNSLKLRSRKTVGELMTFVKLPNNKAGAEGKSHDDAVISAAIADALLKLRPLKREINFL